MSAATETANNIISATLEPSDDSGTTTRRPHLPVLIIPGFMSSGLEIKSSKLQESWQGKRLWLNLVSLGLGDFFTSTASGQNTTTGKKSFAAGGASIDTTGRSSAAGARPRESFKSTLAHASVFQGRPYDDDNGYDGENMDESRKQKEAADQHLAVHRNVWLKHMGLMDDMKSEHPDVEVRAMEGLAGVDYLTPGTLTDHLSYVFGPVIKALKRVGYQEGITLDASPYDWRLPPSELEHRDEYFTRTMRKVENLYEKSGGMPVVLVCHSLGCKAGHYFLDFASAKDKGWCKKYVHTYMPVGGPHLGAPKALRASVTGDKMGLDAFLNTSEALAMGRSFGSGPWLIPSTVPSFAPENVFVRREGAFEINIQSAVNVGPLLEHRNDDAIPDKIELVLRYGKRTLTTKFAPIIDNKVKFVGKFIFSTGPEGPFAKRCCSICCQCCVLRCACCACCSDNTLIISLCEPGLQAARGTKKRSEARRKCCSEDSKLIWLKIITCWYVVKWVFIIFGYIIYLVYYKLWVLMVDAISKSSGGSTQLAVGAPVDLQEFVGDADDHDTEVELRSDLKRSVCCRKEMPTIPTVIVNIRWIPPEMPSNGGSKACQLAELSTNRSRRIGELTCVQDKEKWEYDASSGYGILKKEGFDAALSTVTEIYDSDPFEPRGSRKAPPVKIIKAIYGINIPTEVGAVYKRKRTIAERKNKVKSMYKLDKYAKLQPKGLHGMVLDHGILLETRDTPQMIDGPTKFRTSALAKEMVRCSGDGTVPYWSLQFVRTWKNQCKVSVTELEGAEHREILADRRFHDILIDYVTTKDDAVVDQV